MKCLENFRRLSPHLAEYVYAPSVFWNLSTPKLLTMEFMDGAEISDVKKIQRLGIQPSEVAKLVSPLTVSYLIIINRTILRNKESDIFIYSTYKIACSFLLSIIHEYG